jgi:hypothetical protein
MSHNTQVCVGCGSEYVGDCEACYERLKRCVNVFAHWPMETSATPAALYHVEAAIRFYLSHRMERDGMKERPELRAELQLIATNIRAYLQHVAAGLNVFTTEPTDEELLS